MSRKAYPTDVSDEEWEFVVPYLTLIWEVAAQRRYPLRELFDDVRWIVKAGCPWRLLPNGLAALDGGAAASRTMEEGGLLCSHGARPARNVALLTGTHPVPHGGRAGWQDDTKQSGEWRASRLQLLQA